MTKRKYMSEFGLNMFATPQVLLQQENLDHIGEDESLFHVYIIGRRPRITIDPDSFRVTPDRVSGRFRKQVGAGYVEIPFDVPNLMGRHDLSLVTSYPFTEMSLVDSSGASIQRGKCALVLGILGAEFQEHLDLEVLYIGQAFGQSGERSATTRLKSHSTLQGIYAEAIRNSPDQDVWLVLLGFEPIVLASFDGRKQEYGVSEEEDAKHIRTVIKGIWTEEQMSEQQKINFTEAALIRYFSPPYNVIYKDSFPNPAHSSYQECYDIDLNMVCVEVNSADLRVRLWSQLRAPDWVHICHFPLHSRQDRIYMFEPPPLIT